MKKLGSELIKFISSSNIQDDAYDTIKRINNIMTI